MEYVSLYFVFITFINTSITVLINYLKYRSDKIFSYRTTRNTKSNILGYVDKYEY